MKIFFLQDNLSSGDWSPHNNLATLSASYSHEIRFAEPGVYAKILSAAYGNVITEIPTEYKCLRKICLVYDGASYNVSKFHDVIRFGDTCSTYPVDYNFIPIKRLNQVVSFGKIDNEEQFNRYVSTLKDFASSKSIVIANRGQYATKLKDSLRSEGVSYTEPENDSMVLLDAYLRTSDTLVHFGDGWFGQLHAKASLFALKDNANYITNTEIREPTDIKEFLKRIGA